jgi:uncharacterized protein
MSNPYYKAASGVKKTVEALIVILKNVESEIKQKSENGLTKYETLETEIMLARLATDMFSFSKQITIISDNLKGIFSRLSSCENPKMDDTETNLMQLIQRLQATVDYANSIPESSFDNASSIKAMLPMAPGKYMTADDYLYQFAIPNVYFHLATAYGLLRTSGYKIGKKDFIGEQTLYDL